MLKAVFIPRISTAFLYFLCIIYICKKPHLQLQCNYNKESRNLNTFYYKSNNITKLLQLQAKIIGENYENSKPTSTHQRRSKTRSF